MATRNGTPGNAIATGTASADSYSVLQATTIYGLAGSDSLFGGMRSSVCFNRQL